MIELSRLQRFSACKAIVRCEGFRPSDIAPLFFPDVVQYDVEIIYHCAGHASCFFLSNIARPARTLDRTTKRLGEAITIDRARVR